MINRFIKYLSAEKYYSSHTVEAYRRDIELFTQYMGVSVDEFSPSDIVHTDIRSWIMSMSQEKCSVATISRRISSLRSFYKYLLKRGLVEVDPTLKISKLRKPHRLPSFVEKSKTDIMVKYIAECSDDFGIERDTLILLMFYSTGIRLAELISIDIKDIDTENKEIKITGKGDKQRIVPFSEILFNKIINYLKVRGVDKSDALFINKKGDRISRTEVYRVVNGMLKLIGVNGKCSPHVLRHTFATHLLGAGVGIEVVKELLGHANLSTTQIYTYNTIEQLKQAYSDSHPFGNKIKK